MLRRDARKLKSETEKIMVKKEDLGNKRLKEKIKKEVDK